MESASSDRWRVRQATARDAPAIGHLLQGAGMRHVHADWHLPIDWLGTPGFVLCDRATGESDEADLVGCLAVGADPPPAAWVRVAALRVGSGAYQRLKEMIEPTLPWLCGIGVSTLGWLPTELWPSSWLSDLGFRIVNQIVTYDLLQLKNSNVKRGAPTIRPVDVSDLPHLALIEERAFDPLWRHSAEGLLLAYRQALSFEKADIDGRTVGFQYSVAGHDGVSAHLVRLSVEPDAQGRGVGSSLMASALEGYAKRGFRRATLNTQLDNYPSHRLYERFGFRQIGDRLPVWAMDLV